MGCARGVCIWHLIEMMIDFQAIVVGWVGRSDTQRVCVKRFVVGIAALHPPDVGGRFGLREKGNPTALLRNAMGLSAPIVRGGFRAVLRR